MKIVITEAQHNRLVKHLYQPDGISCGPTCIKMVGDFFKGEVDSIDEICKSCGTDNITGTPPERMRKGLDSLDIQYIEHMDEENPYDSLRSVIDNGSVAMLRTLTQRVPHWIVVHSYEDDTFYVNDPWLGQLTYDETDLEDIWRERNYFFFEVVKENKEEEIDEHSYGGEVVLRPYNESTDALEIYNKLEEVYSKIGWPKDAIWNELQPIDSSLSIVAEVDGNVAGFYIIKEQNIPLLGREEDEMLSKLRGIEGVALGIFNEYKDYGIGKEMIEYPKTIGADYIWGLQLKSLGNIEDWLKRRKLYADVGQMYITYQIFNNNEKSN
jgi:hypothetical protein